MKEVSISIRRSEFAVDVSTKELHEIMQQSKIGHLGIIDDKGFPRVIPLNFIYSNEGIYFHGASDGEKYSLFQKKPLVSFSVAIPFSFIPSYWSAKEYACPATIFFKSVLIRGSGTIIPETDEKAALMQLLMEKYQPEGGYEKIDPGNKLYQKVLKKTALFFIEPINTSVKVKMGQNLNKKSARELITNLEKRGQAIDLQTAQEMRKYLDL